MALFTSSSMINSLLKQCENSGIERKLNIKIQMYSGIQSRCIYKIESDILNNRDTNEFIIYSHLLRSEYEMFFFLLN